MAENSALQKLSEQLTCPVCLEYYKDPKVLSCHHVFCCNCLEGLARKENPKVLICPTCRHETFIPEDLVCNLKSAFYIHSLVDIKEILLEQQVPSEQTKSDASQKGECCPNHPDRILEMFCDTCASPICCACIVNDHKSHSFSLITDITKEQKRTLSLQSKLLEQQVQVTQSQIGNINIDIARVKQQHTIVQEKVRHNFEIFRKVLNAREKEIIDNLDEKTQQKLKSLVAKKSSLETIEQEAKHVIDISKTIESIVDIIAGKKQVTDMLLRATASRLSKDSIDRPELSFLYKQSDIDNLMTVGGLYTQTPCASNSVLQCINNSASIELGNSVSLILDIKDQHGSNLNCLVRNLKCEIIPCGLTSNSVIVPVNLVKCSQAVTGCCYKVSCTPAVRGRHQLSITINNEHVTGSPCQIVVWPPVVEYSVPVHSVNNLKAPWGIAINSRDQVLITEIKNHSLLFFDQEANKIVRTVGRNILSDTFRQPSDIFVADDDQLYIIEQHTFVIKKCDKDGNVTISVGSPGQTSLQFNSPFGMCVNPLNGRLYIADMQNNRIQVLNSDLTFHSFIFGSEDNKRAIQLPTDIAFDPSGNMFITDNQNHCVCIYSPKCEFLKAFGKKGTKEGRLGLPFGICLDNKGHIFVTELLNNRVSIFKTSGEFVKCIGSSGSNPGQFKTPHKIVLDKAGYLYVTDTGNNRLQIF